MLQYINNTMSVAENKCDDAFRFRASSISILVCCRDEQHCALRGPQRYVQPVPLALLGGAHEHPPVPAGGVSVGHLTLGHHRSLPTPQEEVLHCLTQRQPEKELKFNIYCTKYFPPV